MSDKTVNKRILHILDNTEGLSQDEYDIYKKHLEEQDKLLVNLQNENFNIKELLLNLEMTNAELNDLLREAGIDPYPEPLKEETMKDLNGLVKSYIDANPKNAKYFGKENAHKEGKGNDD